MNLRTLAPLRQMLGPSWSVAVREQAAWFGTRDRWIVHIEDGTARVRGSADHRDEWIEAPLDGDLDAVVRNARWWRDRLTIHRLQPGRTYRVVHAFTDAAGRRFAEGETLTFLRLEYLPEDDGFCVHFAEEKVWLHGEGPLGADFDLYVDDAAA